MAGVAMKVPARALLAASPMASVQAGVGQAATATGPLISDWIKITAVPLLVFLIGACVWGCIEKTAAWRMLTEDGGRDSSRPIDRLGNCRCGGRSGDVGDDRHVSADRSARGATDTDAHKDGPQTSDIGDALVVVRTEH